MTRSFLDQPFSRRSLLRGGLLFGAGLTFGSGIVGCATPTGTPGPTTVSLALNRSLVSLDNKYNQFDAAVTVQRAVRQALTEIDANLTPRLVLAERFDPVEPTRWLVRLRPGVVYSDGSPVTVDDVATALEMYQGVEGSFVGSFFPEWPTVDPIDETGFHLVTTRPLPVLDYLMSNILITPAAANRPEELQGGVGSGPYIVTEADRGTGNYTLERNANYWGEPPHIETVRVRFVPEESSRVVAVRSGEVDVIDSITPDSADQLAGLDGVVIDRVESVRLNQLFYNFRKPSDHPLADVNVRRALTYAIDGGALVDQVMQGASLATPGVVPPSLAGAARVGQYIYDPDRAQSELDSLGVRDLQIRIIWETGEFAADADIMEAVVQMLSRVGVRAALQQFEPGGDIMSWRQGRAGDWDVLGNGYSAPTGLAQTIMQGMYAGTAEKEATGDTYHGYVFPEVTATIDAASVEPDRARRDALLADAQQQIWDTVPMLWSFVPKVTLARRERIEDVVLRPTNSYDLARTSLAS